MYTHYIFFAEINLRVFSRLKLTSDIVSLINDVDCQNLKLF